jgi:flagellar assembly protein FliH
MSNQFEPYNNEGKNSEFSAWEYQSTKLEDQPEMTQEETLLKECDLLKKEAFEKGYAEGMQQAKSEIDAKTTELSKWVDFIQNPVKLVDDQLIQEIIQTMIWLCKHCIGVDLSANPEQLRALFNEIKDELPSLSSNKVLTMNPIDVEWIVTQIDKKDLPGLHEILVADPSLGRGDFYLKSEHSDLDGRLQTRLSTLFTKYINKDSLVLFTQAQD